MPIATQAILNLDLPFQARLVDILPGQNEALLDYAQQWVTRLLDEGLQSPKKNEPSVLVWGQTGGGKTMLAQALAYESQAIYLHPASSPEAFAKAWEVRSVVVDGIDAFDENRAIAAFDLFNHLHQHEHSGGRWWAFSEVPPVAMYGLIADVSSRMAWGLVFEMKPLDEMSSIQAMQAQAERLGFTLTAHSALYLLLRLERNLSIILKHLSSLNHYALSLKKPINTHLIHQWYSQVYLPALQQSLL